MHPKVKAWGQLLRIPNTLTASADVLAGFSMAAGGWFSHEGVWLPLTLVATASIFLYWAGMVLNDVHDVEIDRAQRRLGPLVDERISISTALKTGKGLLVASLVLVVLAVFALPTGLSLDEDSGISKGARWWVIGIAFLLQMCIVAYDSPLKKTGIGPPLMGACRGLNMAMGVLLGACFLWPSVPEWSAVVVAIGGHVAFVTGITLAARRESALDQSRMRLVVGWSVSLLGVVAIALCSTLAQPEILQCNPWTTFPVLVFLLASPWLRRAYNSVVQLGPATLVLGIKQAIMTIIFFDAALALQFAGNIPGLIVCGLAIPTLALGRYFRMT
jgi:4-hydroxybenzoate polyprenyltransferase